MGDGVDVAPRISTEAAQALGRPGRAAPEHECVVCHLHGESIARLDAERTPRLAWYCDLMLGTDLCA
jgi:hypothetical protein